MAKRPIEVPPPAPMSVPDDQLDHGTGIPLTGPPPVAPPAGDPPGVGGAFDPDLERINAETVLPSGKGPDLAGEPKGKQRSGPGGDDPPDRITY